MVDAIDGNAAVLKLRAKLDADILKDHAKLLESAIADVLGVIAAGAPRSRRLWSSGASGGRTDARE